MPTLYPPWLAIGLSSYFIPAENKIRALVMEIGSSSTTHQHILRKNKHDYFINIMLSLLLSTLQSNVLINMLTCCFNEC